MTIFVNESTKDISLYLGDSGNLLFKGFPTDKNYTAYLAVTDPETAERVLPELFIQTNRQSEVIFSVPASHTDLLEIPVDELKQEYVYGLKICYGDEETTLIPYVDISKTKPSFKKAPKFTVYRKYVEGNYE